MCRLSSVFWKYYVYCLENKFRTPGVPEFNLIPNSRKSAPFINSELNGLLPKSLFALSKAFFDKSKARYPAGFAKIYLQKSALMTAQRDLYLGNSP
jgi:hypothetical protein